MRANRGRNSKPPLFKLEEHWDEQTMGLIPCWGRRSGCLLNPEGKGSARERARLRRVGCGDCDLFLTQKEIEKRIEIRKNKEKREAIKQWIRRKYYSGDADHTPPEDQTFFDEDAMLRAMDREREERERSDD